MSRTSVSYTFSGEWQTVWTTLVVRQESRTGVVAECGGVRVGPEADALSCKEACFSRHVVYDHHGTVCED